MTLPETADQLPKLDKYEIFEEIGHGGMATVYRGKDPRLGREVAVKIIHRHLRDNGEVAARFVAEARAAAKLKHKGIVEVYDVSREEDRERYLVAELIRGVTLRKILLEHRDMPAEVGAAIVVELCDAVEHAHEAGIVHRDIKPENVLVERPSDRGTSSGRRTARADSPRDDETPATPDETSSDDEVVDELASSAPRAVDRRTPNRSVDDANEPDNAVDAVPSDDGSAASETPSGRARPPKSGKHDERVLIKLTDFGIAKVLDAQGVTSTGQVLGSPAHMAPEQIEGGEVDVRTDVFALGVLLYECMVGHLPFEGKNPAQVLRRVIEGDFSPADAERATVGSRFAAIVARALATSAADRTPSPSALGAELRKELEELGLRAPAKEIAAYFKDPKSYTEELPKRIVPRLVTRGEAARRAKRIPLAASDFNRAHALAPGDPSILKRITALSSARGRVRAAKRVVALAVGAVAIAGVTYGVVRFSRSYGVNLAVDSAPTLVDNDPPSLVPHAPAHDDPSRMPRPSAIASSAPERTAAVPHPVGSGDAAFQAGAVVSPRKVRFAVSPMGAKLEVDGSPAESFGSTLTLSVGSHPFSLVPPPNETCCDKNDGSFNVPAAPKDKPDEVLTVPLALKPRPATVEYAGPSGSTVVCGLFGTLSAGATKVVKLSTVDWSGPCTFTYEEKTLTHAVTVRAGQSTTISWPG
jgi:eukaryotic-like serine/threonine-protein kinase